MAEKTRAKSEEAKAKTSNPIKGKKASKIEKKMRDEPSKIDQKPKVKKIKKDAKKSKISHDKTAKIDRKDIEKVILQLNTEGNSPSRIGQILKVKYNVHNVREVLGIGLADFLRERKVYDLPEDLQNLIEKNEVIKKHIELNKRDFVSKRRLEINSAKLRNLSNYYKRKKIISRDWKY